MKLVICEVRRREKEKRNRERRRKSREKRIGKRGVRTEKGIKGEVNAGKRIERGRKRKEKEKEKEGRRMRKRKVGKGEGRKNNYGKRNERRQGEENG